MNEFADTHRSITIDRYLEAKVKRRSGLDWQLHQKLR